MKRMRAESVDAVVTDPPYGLGSPPPMEDVLRAWLAGEPYHARGAGFMGKEWDAFVPGPEVWREALRALKPGGHLLAFFGSRTFDLGALAIRLAGFEVRDTLSWLYGAGFPKSLDVRKAIEASPEYESAPSEAAQRAAVTAYSFDGWGTALKPAWEPIILARKPLVGTVAANVLQHGTGALNVDGCRIASADKLVRPAIRREDNEVLGRGLGAGRQDEPGGRWPSNVLLDEHAVELLDAQTGTLKSGAWNGQRNTPKTKNTFNAFDGGPEAPRAASEGGASRFFYVAKARRSERDAGCESLPARTGGDATGREDGSAGTNSPRAGAGRTGGARNTHPTVKPVELMRWLVRLVTPPGGLVLDPFTGSGSTGVAALREGFRFVGVEQSQEYSEIARCRLTGETT